ncbi:hypothetical protein B0H34DRAFT_728504 [Crassisporium funariophilum]|nr:hypothetical protein B0H34DRAFT_728504 [Crassisporium funariophilum]
MNPPSSGFGSAANTHSVSEVPRIRAIETQRMSGDPLPVPTYDASSNIKTWKQFVYWPKLNRTSPWRLYEGRTRPLHEDLICVEINDNVNGTKTKKTIVVYPEADWADIPILADNQLPFVTIVTLSASVSVLTCTLTAPPPAPPVIPSTTVPSLSTNPSPNVAFVFGNNVPWVVNFQPPMVLAPQAPVAVVPTAVSAPYLDRPPMSRTDRYADIASTAKAALRTLLCGRRSREARRILNKQGICPRGARRILHKQGMFDTVSRYFQLRSPEFAEKSRARSPSP